MKEGQGVVKQAKTKVDSQTEIPLFYLTESLKTIAAIVVLLQFFMGNISTRIDTDEILAALEPGVGKPA
jgi:hypothetical protein